MQNGKEAVTLFQPIKSYGGYTLLEAIPKTGRTHQIRVHLKHLKTPILGDQIYGFKKINEQLKIKHQLLHAKSICFTHPTTAKNMKITADYPLDFASCIKKIDKYF